MICNSPVWSYDTEVVGPLYYENLQVRIKKEEKRERGEAKYIFGEQCEYVYLLIQIKGKTK